MPPTQQTKDAGNCRQETASPPSSIDLSVVIPARDEAGNIAALVSRVRTALRAAEISYQIIVVNDNSSDDTEREAIRAADRDRCVTVISPRGSPGFGSAVRVGFSHARGSVIAVFMGDGSDHPDDLVRCYKMMTPEYDAVFGSRFMRGSAVSGYPTGKWIFNRLANRSLQLLFWTKHDDLTNAFKVYRWSVIRDCGPFGANGFSITLEIALWTLVRKHRIARAPIQWHGRTAGTTSFHLWRNMMDYLWTAARIYLKSRRSRLAGASRSGSDHRSTS